MMVTEVLMEIGPKFELAPFAYIYDEIPIENMYLLI